VAGFPWDDFSLWFATSAEAEDLYVLIAAWGEPKRFRQRH
jgi:hypothetical protein